MKFRDLPLASFGFIVALIAIAVFPNDTAIGRDPISGVPRVVDGDTVWIGASKIRLEGIDAPETDQICLDPAGKAWNCGISSRDELTKRTSGQVWTCHVSGKDRYQRDLARCDVNGEDIQRWMVRNGWALSFVRYSHAYDADEADAKAAKAGLWAGAFIAPWDWRARSPRTVILGSLVVPTNAQKLLISPRLAQGPPTGDCTIKGNVNRSGECIFHMPGSRYYDRVKMDLAKGKRWFCTASEAEAADCRASK
jgi:endonuclease YncB( thermonuclease family)